MIKLMICKCNHAKAMHVINYGPNKDISWCNECPIQGRRHTFQVDNLRTLELLYEQTI